MSEDQPKKGKVTVAKASKNAKKITENGGKPKRKGKKQPTPEEVKEILTNSIKELTTVISELETEVGSLKQMTQFKRVLELAETTIEDLKEDKEMLEEEIKNLTSNPDEKKAQ